MHHHNCFIISAIARSLNETLKGQYLEKCFSNSIDEIYFEFNHSSFRCVFYKGELFFNFENDIVGENRLFKPQFKEIVNALVLSVEIHPYERSFHIEFDNGHQLAFKCFGRKSNVLLFSEDQVTDLFRKNIATDLDLTWEQLVRPIQPVYESAHFSNEAAFTNQYPYLPIEIFESMKRDASGEQFDSIINNYHKACYLAIDDKPMLTFNLESKENNVLNTVTEFTSAYLKSKIFSEQKTELIQKFSAQLKEKENYLKSNSAALEKLQNTRKDEEIGNIILANLHTIKEGEKKIIVNDVYHNCPIEIKMDEKLSAMKNADAYFKKDKARPYILKQLELKVNNSVTEIEKLKDRLMIVENAKQMRDLKAYTKSTTTDKGVVNLPYKYFKVDEYEILVGKHAESNEKLLNYFSDKDDVWLHAKDVGGSHVIIKIKKNKPLPDNILEKAASLAAYFSKSRQQDLATVAYTFRKFVRKIKGAEKGKVTISNEKTILVKPGIPS